MVFSGSGQEAGCGAELTSLETDRGRDCDGDGGAPLGVRKLE